jgi:hypothetical protein
MSEKFKITKLDRRHNGFGYFTHSINYKRGKIASINFWRDQEETFLDHRIWCWETFGSSCELGMFPNHHTISQSWAWDTNQKQLKLYLTEKAMSFFTMAKSN